MGVKAIVKIQKLVEALIVEGENVMTTEWVKNTFPPTHFVDLQTFRQWQSRCSLLIQLLGVHAKPWENALSSKHTNGVGHALSMLGALKGARQSIEEGLLARMEDLVFAEAFADLYEQGEYLFNQGYFLAAGVIGRAVLEEKLRNLCAANACLPSKQRSTIADYYAELYKGQVIDKITMKHVEALAAVGNDAAHNAPSLRKDDVRRLLDGVRDFLAKFSA